MGPPYKAISPYKAVSLYKAVSRFKAVKIAWRDWEMH